MQVIASETVLTHSKTNLETISSFEVLVLNSSTVLCSRKLYLALDIAEIQVERLMKLTEESIY